MLKTNTSLKPWSVRYYFLDKVVFMNFDRKLNIYWKFISYKLFWKVSIQLTCPSSNFDTNGTITYINLTRSIEVRNYLWFLNSSRKLRLRSQCRDSIYKYMVKSLWGKIIRTLTCRLVAWLGIRDSYQWVALCC